MRYNPSRKHSQFNQEFGAGIGNLIILLIVIGVLYSAGIVLIDIFEEII